MTDELRHRLKAMIAEQVDSGGMFDAIGRHEIIMDGTNWKGLNNMTDLELLNEFEMSSGFDSPWSWTAVEMSEFDEFDQELAALYRMILAEYPTDPNTKENGI